MGIKPKNNITNLQRIKDFGNDRSRLVRLDKNERTVPFEAEIYAEMLTGLLPELLPMYPDQSSLYRKLAAFCHVNEDCLLLTPGSDAALKYIFETYVAKGDQVIFLDPTYAMIEVYADMFEAEKLKIGYTDDLKLDFAKLIKEIKGDTRAVFVANPNQPTATILTESEIRQILEKTALTNTLLVIDEAYLPFSNEPSSIQFILQYPQLIVVQTFSKAFGLASARLGFMASHPANIEALYKVKPLADINLFAIKLGECLIARYSVVADYIKSVGAAKEFLEGEFKRLGIDYIKGHANFVHLRFPKHFDSKKIAERMEEHGYLIRIAGAGLPAVLQGCVRITVGPLEQMQDFLKVLLQVLPAAKLETSDATR